MGGDDYLDIETQSVSSVQTLLGNNKINSVDEVEDKKDINNDSSRLNSLNDIYLTSNGTVSKAKNIVAYNEQSKNVEEDEIREEKEEKKFEEFKPVVATTSMCKWCFDVLIQQLHQNKNKNTSSIFSSSYLLSIAPPFIKQLSSQNFASPVFITWLKKKKGEEGIPFAKSSNELRGCIGSLEPIPIHEIGSYALKSALKDRRFNPIEEKEISQLICKISLLSNFQKCKTLYDWIIGVHGIIINFTDSFDRKYSSTFLPEVPKEHSMSHRIAIHELILKAGYRGNISKKILDSISVTRYESSRASLNFDEYVINLKK